MPEAGLIWRAGSAVFFIECLSVSKFSIVPWLGPDELVLVNVACVALEPFAYLLLGLQLPKFVVERMKHACNRMQPGQLSTSNTCACEPISSSLAESLKKPKGPSDMNHEHHHSNRPPRFSGVANVSCWQGTTAPCSHCQFVWSIAGQHPLNMPVSARPASTDGPISGGSARGDVGSFRLVETCDKLCSIMPLFCLVARQSAEARSVSYAAVPCYKMLRHVHARQHLPGLTLSLYGRLVQDFFQGFAESLALIIFVMCSCAGGARAILLGHTVSFPPQARRVGCRRYISRAAEESAAYTRL